MLMNDMFMAISLTLSLHPRGHGKVQKSEKFTCMHIYPSIH